MDTSASSSATTPEFPLADISAPELSHRAVYPSTHSPVANLLPILDPPLDSVIFPGAPTSAAAPPALGTTPPSSPPAHRSNASSVKLEPLSMGSGLFSLPPMPPSPMSTYHPTTTGSSPLYSPGHLANRLLSLSLWAEGMPGVVFDVDHLSATMAMPPLPPHDLPPSVLIRTKVSITSIGDIHSSPNLHGLHGAITLASRWSSSAKCVTRLFSDKGCISQESAFLEQRPPTHALPYPHLVTCALPESPLSRCKWLEHGEFAFLPSQTPTH
jgi:hypothetical protein